MGLCYERRGERARVTVTQLHALPPLYNFLSLPPYLKTSQMNNDMGRYKFRGSMGQMYRQATLTRRHLVAIVKLHSCHHVL
jgi:hypothetical protein